MYCRRLSSGYSSLRILRCTQVHVPQRSRIQNRVDFKNPTTITKLSKRKRRQAGRYPLYMNTGLPRADTTCRKAWIFCQGSTQHVAFPPAMHPAFCAQKVPLDRVATLVKAELVRFGSSVDKLQGRERGWFFDM